MQFDWDANKDALNQKKHGLSFDEATMSDDIRKLTDEDFARAIPHKQRLRIIRGEIDPEEDIAALRRFAGLTQEEFAEALGISVHTLRNWEQGGENPRARLSRSCVSRLVIRVFFARTWRRRLSRCRRPRRHGL